jgi:hypothetical protein
LLSTCHSSISEIKQRNKKCVVSTKRKRNYSTLSWKVLNCHIGSNGYSLHKIRRKVPGLLCQITYPQVKSDGKITAFLRTPQGSMGCHRLSSSSASHADSTNRYWPLIQHIYKSLPQYFQDPALVPPEYRAAETRLFDEVRQVLNHGVMSENSAFDMFKARLDLHSQNRLYGRPIEIVKRKWSRVACSKWWSEIDYICRLFCEEIKLRSFERWKLREPLVYCSVFNELDSKAYELLF